jgi:DHA1 family bicyclomycin/chloramphenicol resistance-like MFS transporter
VFLLATLGCILAPTVEVFLAFRMLQAVVVVGLVLGRAVVRDMYPADQAASQIGYVTMGMAVVPMIGPAIGGVLDETLGWQANFWMLAILGSILVLALSGATWARPPRADRQLRRTVREYPELSLAPLLGLLLGRGLRLGRLLRLSRRRALRGLRGLRPLGRRGRPLFRRPRAGLFLRKLALRALLRPRRHQRDDPVGHDPLGGRPDPSLLLFLLGLKTALVFFGFMTFVGLGNGMVLPNATSGMLSVRPHLAGTASGLGGAIMIGGGAALSALAGALLTRGEGAYPLMLIMLATSLLAVAAILYTIRRERHVTGG